MRLAAGIALLLLAACVYEAPMDEPARTELPLLAENRAEPRLALAEHLLAEYFASDIVAPPTVCLSVIDGRSEVALPAEQETALIARFARLAPFARCTRAEGGWRDVVTEKPALVFTIHSFTCPSEAECTGWAGYTAGAVSSPAALYRLAWQNNRWRFERDRRLIMD